MKKLIIFISFTMLFLESSAYAAALANTIGAGKLFKGVYGSFSVTSDGVVDTKGVDLADFNRTAVVSDIQTLPVNGSKHLFYLPHQPIQRVLQVTVNGVVLPTRGANSQPNYSYSVRSGWVTLRNAYSSSDNVKVYYEWSRQCDIVAGNFNGPNLIYRNTGNFSFSQTQAPSPAGNKSIGVTAGDFDGDGYVDFSGGNSKISLNYFNNRSGSFKAPYEMGETASTVYDGAWGDYDGDGDLDLIRGHNDTLAGAVIERCQADKTFGEAFRENIYLPSKNDKGVDWGDYDNDGDLDMAIAGEAHLFIWRNDTSTGPFVYIAEKATPDSYAFVGKVDLMNKEEVASVRTYTNPGIPPHVIVPGGISVDSQYVYIANMGKHTIVKLTKQDFTFVAEVGTYEAAGNTNNTFNQPNGLAVDDTYLYVCDAGNNRLVKLLKSDLSFVSAVGTAGSGDDQFSSLAGLVLDDTYLYIVDSGNNRIMKRNKSDLSFVAKVGSLGSGTNQFNNPTGIIVDATAVYITDTNNHRVVKTDKASFNQLAVGGSFGPAPEYPWDPDDHFNKPTGIFDYGIYLYIFDSLNQRMEVRKKSDLSQQSYTAFSTLHMVNTAGLAVLDQGGEVIEHVFVPTWLYGGYQYVTDLVFADMDNDGLLDMVVSDEGSYGSKSIVYKNFGPYPSGPNTGMPNFNYMWKTPAAIPAKGVAVGDVNGDGYLDIVYLRATSPYVALYLNNKNGTFTYTWGSDEDTGNYNNFSPTRARFADLNGDGKSDLVVSAEDNASLSGNYHGIVVFQNQPNGRKVTKITSTSSDGKSKTTITATYSVNDDGTLGHLVSTEIK